MSGYTMQGFNPFLSDVDTQAHVAPQCGSDVADTSVASNPFLASGAFSYEPPAEKPTQQGENPFLSTTQSTAPPVFGSGNPFADFVTPQQPVAVGFMGATESGIDGWNEMQTSYGSTSALELQSVSSSTQNLLNSVTGALEATSDSLLDRLRFQPSPIPQVPTRTPSPRTPSPDLLMGDEDLQMPTFVQPAPPKPVENPNTIDLLGLYSKPTEVAQPTFPRGIVSEVTPDPISILDQDLIPPLAPQNEHEEVSNNVMDMVLEKFPAPQQDLIPTKVEMPIPEPKPEVPETVKPVETEHKTEKIPERPPPARPAQPPKAVPSRPPPPVPPAPKKDPIPVSAPLAEVAPAFNLPKSESYVEAPAAVEPASAYATSVFETSPFSTPDAEPAPVVEPTSVCAAIPLTPAKEIPAVSNDPFGIAEKPTGRGLPPAPPPPRAFPTSPQPAAIAPQNPAVDFDSFEDRFNSFPDGEDSKSQNGGPFGAAFGQNLSTVASAWGDASPGGGDDSSSGFGNEDKFDEFLSLREPPPVPQSTPAKSRLNSGSDDFEKGDMSLSVTIRQKDTLDFKLDLVPSLAPPPKSPAAVSVSGSLQSEENGSFVPFLSSVKPSSTGDVGTIPRSDSQDSPQTPLFEEDQSMPLEDFPRIKFSGDGWEMHMRHPNKKKITGQRFWKKVYVRLLPVSDIPTVQIFNSSKDKDPIQEFPLQPCYSVSDIAAQQFDQYGKIFTVKLQFIFYKERPGVRPGQITKAEKITNKLSQFAAYAIQGDYQGVKEFGSDLKKLGLPLEHAPQVSQLVKLGTQNYEEMKQFSMIIEESLFRLPVHRDRALNYKSEEVQVTLVDEYYVEQDTHGVVTRQIARVRLYFLSFLSGSAEVELGINDIRRQGKEVVGRHDIIPIATEEWIRIEDIEFSSCVQLNVFEETKMVKFKPPDACYIELLRFRVRPPRHRELPLQVKTVFTTTGGRIEIRCDILVPGFTSRKLGQIPCEDVMVRIPIPECWIYMFRVEKHFRYGSVKSAHRRSGKVKGIERFLGAVEAVENSLMEVTSGQAKYEHQHKSIVWRVARLPKEGQGAYTTHSFFCHITLQPHEELPSNLTKHCYVEFTMPHTTISHTVCRSVSVPMCDEPPEKCVKYLSRHEYVVEIEHSQGIVPATYNLAATIAKEELEEKEEPPMEGKALSDSDFSDD